MKSDQTIIEPTMRKSILIIEDSNSLSYILTSLFRKEYHVYTVKNYAEAFYFLRLNPVVDLFIINIPDERSENLMFLAHISTSSLFHTIPVIVLSDSNDKRLGDKTKALGASLFLSTPFDPLPLSEKIKELITEQEQQSVLITGPRTRQDEKSVRKSVYRNYDTVHNHLKLS